MNESITRDRLPENPGHRVAVVRRDTVEFLVGEVFQGEVNGGEVVLKGGDETVSSSGHGLSLLIGPVNDASVISIIKTCLTDVMHRVSRREYTIGRRQI